MSGTAATTPTGTTEPPAGAVHRHRLARAVSALALVGGAVLVVKGLAAAIVADALPDALYSPVYLLAIALVVAAGVAVGALQRGWLRKAVVGLVAALGSVLWLMGLGEALESVVATVTDDRAAQEEAAVVALGVVWVAVGLRLRRRR